MLETLITILLSMNLNFTVINDEKIQLSSQSIIILSSNPDFIEKSMNGEINYLLEPKSDNYWYDIVIIPDVDPIIEQ